MRTSGSTGGRTRTARRVALAAVVGLALVSSLLAADLSRPPARQVAARAALSGIHWYQAHLSAHLGARCRFTLSCSRYAAAVIEKHGALRGGWLAAKRLARCGPWTPAGTTDDPP